MTIQSLSKNFDPFTTSWVLPSWHSKIIQAPPPAVSRVYGAPITGGLCALWNGWNNHTDPEKAYGCVQVYGQKFLLHRYAFACHHDIDIMPWDIIDHLCRRRLCFNPFHHECTTPLENFLRGDGPLNFARAARKRLNDAMEELPF